MRALPCLWAVLLTGLFAAGSHAQSTRVYQWKDASGVTHYSDSPPAGQAQSQNRRISNHGQALAEEAEEKPENPQCTTARQNLKVLSGNTQVEQDSDGDGKPDTMLDDAGKANQKALAEAAVKAYCPASAGE